MPMDAYRALLARPPFTRLRQIGQAPYFPLGIGYLASVILQNPKFDARVYYPENPSPNEKDFRVDKEGVFHARSSAQKRYNDAVADSDHPVWMEFRQILESYKPHCVGISVLTPEVASALKMTRIVKELLPDCPVIWGGVHPTFASDSVLDLPGVDYVVVGEGEHAFAALLANLANHGCSSALPGVRAKSSPHGISECLQNQLIPDLDKIPLPARHQVFFAERFKPIAMGSIMHSRGCPWRCGFCSSRKFWRELVRFRSPENVIEEIRQIHHDFGIRVFTFWDDSFTIDRNLTEKLCVEMLNVKPRIAWRTATRLDLLDDSMLRLMKRAGCVQLELGIETGSSRMSELIRKDIDLGKAPEIIERVNRMGIACGVFMMAGFPDETVEDMKSTMAFIQRIHPAEIVLNIFDPMPGSEQYDRAIELGMLPRHPDFTNFPLWPDAHYVAAIDPIQFNAHIETLSKYVFNYNSSRGAIFRRALPEIKRLLTTDPATLGKKVFQFAKRRMPGMKMV